MQMSIRYIKTTGVIIFIMLFIFQVGCTNEESIMPITTGSIEALGIFQEALNAFESFNSEEARKLFTQAIAKDKDFALAYLYRGLASSSANDRRDDLLKAKLVAPNASSGEQMLIEAYHDYYIEDAVEKWANTLHELSIMYPGDKRIHYYMGIAYYGYYNDYDLAVARFEKALNIDMDFAPPHNFLGYTYINQKNYQAAEEAFDNYIRLQPNQANPRDSKADLLTKLGRFEEANMYYQQAVELDSTFIASKRKIGANMIFMGLYDKGRQELEEALDMGTTPAGKIICLGAIARSYIYKGDFPMAIEYADKAIQLATEVGQHDRAVYYCLIKASIYLELDETDKVKVNLTDCSQILNSTDIIERSKSFARYYSEQIRAILAVRSNDFNKAWSILDDIKANIEAGTDSEAMQAWFYSTAGYISLESGDYREAIESLKKADQEDPWVLYYLAKAYSKADNQPKALELFDKVANWNEDGFSYSFVRSKAFAAIRK